MPVAHIPVLDIDLRLSSCNLLEVVRRRVILFNIYHTKKKKHQFVNVNYSLYYIYIYIFLTYFYI